MHSVSTAIFTDPDDYKLSIREAKMNLVLTAHDHFKAALTHLELPNLHVYRAQENLARIAYISLAPPRFFISIPMSFDLPLIWNGIELQSDDIVLHGIGECMHQRTKGASRWSFISLAPDVFTKFSKALTGIGHVPPSNGRVMRSSAIAVTRLRRRIAAACHVAKIKPDVIMHAEAARSVEEELLYEIVTCMTPADTVDQGVKLQSRTNAMTRFEELLATDTGGQLRLPKICAAVGVPERTLRIWCASVLGMGPGQYVRLRRLNLVRSELCRAGSGAAGTTVTQIAKQYGFSELGHFAIAYWRAFGEKPSTTMRRFAGRF